MFKNSVIKTQLVLSSNCKNWSSLPQPLTRRDWVNLAGNAGDVGSAKHFKPTEEFADWLLSIQELLAHDGWSERARCSIEFKGVVRLIPEPGLW